MKYDLYGRKCVHVSIKKEIHAQLRLKLFARGLSLQEVFNEFCQQYVLDDAAATKIVDRYIMKRAQHEMRDIILKPSFSKLDELQHAVLYNLIDENEKDITEK